jgi:hypothetical protein
VDLRRETAEKLDVGIMVIKPTVAESQSNGSIEAGVKTFKGLLRVHLASLEKKVAMHLPSAHPLMGWLVEYVGDITTKYLQGSDGKTAYNRLFGKEVHEEQLEFGEKVLYKTKPNKEQGVVIDVRWRDGVWLGRSWGSTRHRIMIGPRQVIEARAVQRVPKPNRWDADKLSNLIATTSKWIVADEEEAESVMLPLGGPAPEARPRQNRSTYLDKYIYTIRTSSCGAILLIVGDAHT